MKSAIINLVIALVVLAGVTGILFGGYTLFKDREAETNNASVIFSDTRILLELWGRYKGSMIEEGSYRTLDSQAGNITTSEGQSYTMLRAVWMDDQTAFDNSWTWTKNNLQRPDKLMGWKYGERADGSYGVLTDDGGQNTATDADVDIALSLIMAAGRWKNTTYKAEAEQIIDSIWEKEIVIINGKPVLAANDIERFNTSSIIVNPSYFAPYAYRVFAKVNPEQNWMGVVDSSYDIMLTASQSPFDTGTTNGLPPNWVRVDRTTGAVIPSPEYNSNYGFDAIRIPWRMAMDWNWNQEPRAKQVLATVKPLADIWQTDKKIMAEYKHSGEANVTYETPAMYGTMMSYYDIMQPDKAEEFYKRQLTVYYDPDTQSWKDPLYYYDDNMVWFGIAMHNNQLVNLTELLDD